MTITPHDYNIPALEADPKASAEEIRRAKVAEKAGRHVDRLLTDLIHLAEKDLRQVDPLSALIDTANNLMEVGYQTRGQLRAAQGYSDLFLEVKAANVQSGLRRAASLIHGHDQDLGVWAESVDLLKPVLEDIQRAAKDLDRPGMKAALAPVPEKQKPAPGPRLLEDDGEPAPAAAAVATEVFPDPPAQEEPAAVLPPMPNLLAGFPTEEAGQEKAWRVAIQTFYKKGLAAELTGWEGFATAWWDEWDNGDDPLEAVRRLIYATEFREPFSYAYPTDEEFATWCAGFGPMAEPAPMPTLGCQIVDVEPEADLDDIQIVPNASDESQDEFDMWDETERTQAFEGLLERLLHDGIKAGLKRAAWAKAQKAWQAAIDKNAKDAYTRLTFAVRYRPETSWVIPSDEVIRDYNEQQALEQADGLEDVDEFPLLGQEA